MATCHRLITILTSDGIEGNIMVDTLTRTASILRARIIETSHRTSTPHLGSCLSCVDILTAAYFDVLRIDPSKPSDPDRDRFILSKGHGAPALFQVLAMKGFFPQSLMDDYGADGSIFAEHPPTPDHLPGIEAATGSLGHGLPLGLGFAYAGMLQKRDYRVYALLGDGECNEGSVWEAAMLAPALGLTQICAIVDYNKWQATDRSNAVTALEVLSDKWRSFGWSVYEVDGHDVDALAALMRKVPDGSGKPVAIIAHTVKGKGASFMEDDNNWHYRIPNEKEVAAAKQELGVD
jgi:transketolase